MADAETGHGANVPVVDLVSALTLVDTGARTDEDIFTASNIPTPHGRIFGGQVLAQSVVAAQNTIEDDRPLHSMHGYFLRPGAIDAPITFSVDRIHDGRSFSTRRTQVYQRGEPIFSMIASFQVPADGVDHQIDGPTDVPDPDELPSIADASISWVEGEPWWDSQPFELKIAATSDDDGALKSQRAVWFRTRERLPDSPELHRAALAFASDYTLLGAVLDRHGLQLADTSLRVASLDHAMWWHRPGRADDWVLYVQESPSATGGRGLAFGRMYDRDGVLIASTAQEGMVRVPRERL